MYNQEVLTLGLWSRRELGMVKPYSSHLKHCHGETIFKPSQTLSVLDGFLVCLLLGGGGGGGFDIGISLCYSQVGVQ